MPSDESNAAIALHAATAHLAEKINRSLARQFRREEKNSGTLRPDRARLDADEAPAESLGSAAVPVIEDDRQAKGKGKARQVD